MNLDTVWLDLNLITYGCGDSFHSHKFNRIRNDKSNKPLGGLWASPVDSHWGWKDWSEAEDWGDLSSFFHFDYSGDTLVINGESDLKKLIAQSMSDFKFSRLWPDFEEMKKKGVDGIFITEQGESETRFSEPGLYGWDCESIVVLTLSSIKNKGPE